MTWKGFHEESKSYMNYPKCGKVYFWKNYPMAAIRFYLSCLLDWHRLRRLNMKLKD